MLKSSAKPLKELSCGFRIFSLVLYCLQKILHCVEILFIISPRLNAEGIKIVALFHMIHARNVAFDPYLGAWIGPVISQIKGFRDVMTNIG